MTIYEKIFQDEFLPMSDIALVNEQQEFTYGELQKRIIAFGNVLKNTYSEQKKILILLKNSPELVISIFAVTQAGHIAILADSSMKSEINYIIHTYSIDLVICKEQDKNMWNMENNIHTMVEKEIWCDDQTESACLESCNLSEDDECLVLCTSGVTGHPKLISNSHSTLIEALNNYTNTVNFSRGERMLGVTPFFHSYCLGSALFAGLYKRCRIYLLDNFNPRKVLKIITDKKIQIFHGVSFMYQEICRHFDPEKYDLRSLKICISAGGALKEEIFNAFYKISNKCIHQEYGSTETGTIAINMNDDIEMCIHSVGQPLHGVEVDIRMKDDLQRVYVKSKGCALGYYNGKRFCDEWFETGDIGHIENGYIFLEGRVGRLIDIHGKKIDPYEIENCLMRHENITDAYVKKVEKDDCGPVIGAYIVANREISYEEIYTLCNNYIAVYKIPKYVERVQTLDKTGLGKHRCI